MNIKDGKVFIEENELAGFIGRFTAAFRYWNKGKNPDTVVLPSIKEVKGVKVEYPRVEAKQKSSKNGN